MNETWKPVVGFNGYYEVSDQGNVRSVPRTIPYRGGYKDFPGRILVQRADHDGYLRVNLSIQGKAQTVKVHTLVATAFIPNPDRLTTVNHKNEVKTDNRMENLEWLSNLDNIKYGTRQTRSGLQRRKRILCLDSKGNIVKTYDSLTSVVLDGFHISAVSQCCNGKTVNGMHKGYYWQFDN